VKEPFDILGRHNAAPKCQFDAFAEYVAAAEKRGIENFPLYQWTRSRDRIADLGAKFFAEVRNRVLDAKLCVALLGPQEDNRRGTRHGPA